MQVILAMAALFLIGLVLGRMSALDQLRHAAHIRDMVARYDRAFGIDCAQQWQAARRRMQVRKVRADQWWAMTVLWWGKVATVWRALGRLDMAASWAPFAGRAVSR